MHWINWVIVAVYLVVVVLDGLRRTRGTTNIEGYFLANRNLPWWAVGLSVMATQLSAITLIGTTGQGATDGLRFVQFYFGLPIAMVILGVTLVPFLHGAKVYTAYEFLERRFDAKTRSLTSLLFLLSRGLSAGTIIAAPSVVLSSIFGWDLTLCVALIGLPTVIYTVLGGVQAVAWADVKQMFVIAFAMLAIITALIVRMPIPLDDALHIAGAVGRLQVFDFSFDFSRTYTFWSGILGGTFLMLSYFGTDQSQVQRYLSAKSVDEARTSLLMSAYWKIPLQALVLLVGVLTFVFYVFTRPPMLFNTVHEQAVRTSARAGDFAAVESRFTSAYDAQRNAAKALAANGSEDAASAAAFVGATADMKAARVEAGAIVKDVSGDRAYNDVNYVFPTFVLTQLPVGLVGLLIAAILVAAMTASSAELSALSTATVIDFYRRWIRPDASDRQLLVASRVAVGLWGVFASVVAVYAAELGSLIEVVNRFGSFFYGSILGVFVLAIGFPRTNAHGAFIGLFGGMAAVTYVATQTNIEFLWLNLVGVVAVCLVGVPISALTGGNPRVEKA